MYRDLRGACTFCTRDCIEVPFTDCGEVSNLSCYDAILYILQRINMSMYLFCVGESEQRVPSYLTMTTHKWGATWPVYLVSCESILRRTSSITLGNSSYGNSPEQSRQFPTRTTDFNYLLPLRGYPLLWRCVPIKSQLGDQP